jgi:hypothetical protein
MLKVIGAGLGRTGTASLKAALEQLNLNKCYHMYELMESPDHIRYFEDALDGRAVNWDVMFQGYQAAVDYPVASFYKQLMEYYPEAKVVLTVREPERWYESARNTIYSSSNRIGSRFGTMLTHRFFPDKTHTRRRRTLIQELIWKGQFEGRFEERDYAVNAYAAWNEEVKRYVPPERLLTYEVNQGWEPLCAFLDVPVPDIPFPRTNSRDEFQARMFKRNPLAWRFRANGGK